MLRNNVDACRCSYFEFGLPVVPGVLNDLGIAKKKEMKRTSRKLFIAHIYKVLLWARR